MLNALCSSLVPEWAEAKRIVIERNLSVALGSKKTTMRQPKESPERAASEGEARGSDRSAGLANEFSDNDNVIICCV